MPAPWSRDGLVQGWARSSVPTNERRTRLLWGVPASLSTWSAKWPGHWPAREGTSPVERGSESGTELVTVFQPSLAFSGDKTHPFVFSLVELGFYNLQLKEHYWSKKMFLLPLLFAYRLALPGSL